MSNENYYLMEEKKLLDDAKLWFLENYGKSNDEVGYRYVQIWYKPVVFS